MRTDYLFTAPLIPSLLTLSSGVYNSRQVKTFCLVNITCRRFGNPHFFLFLHSASWRFDRAGWEISQHQGHVWPVQAGIDRNRTTTDYHGLLGKFICTIHTFSHH